MKQQQKKLKLETAITILTDVVARDKGHFWLHPPEAVIQQLTDNAVDGEITYNMASRILDNAQHFKMQRGANLGMPKIKELWQKNYLKDET